MSITEGQAAPTFSLPASGDRTVSTTTLAGQLYVLYFYPKADTSGCTKEAQAFQALLPAFTKKGVEIIGVSRDPMRALDKFAAKYSLTFPMASDEAGALTTAYGVWVEKSMYGRKYMGIERTTVLVGADGKVLRVWQKVKVEGHAGEVLAAVG
jgi:thioredoxin-dependent peroxiredoxin